MQEILLVNPSRRRRRKKKTTTRRRNTNPARRRRRTTTRKRTYRRRRRNPAGMRGVQGQVMTAFQGASGALLLDVTLGYLPIPANLKAGLVGTGVKAALAIALGVFSKQLKIVRPATAAKFADGALTVVLHDELKRQVAQFLPNVPMGEYLSADYENDMLSYYGSGLNPGPVYLPDISDEGMNIDEGGLGEYLGPEFGDDYDTM